MLEMVTNNLVDNNNNLYVIPLCLLLSLCFIVYPRSMSKQHGVQNGLRTYRRWRALVLSGLPSTKMPMTWINRVTHVNDKEKFCKEMKCHKISSKFVKSLTCGASIS